MREIIDDIITEDKRAAEVIRRVGDLYRRGDVEFAALDVNELVRETLEILRTELVMRHVTPVLALANDLPAVSGNRVQLQQLFLNLLLNAADAMSRTAMEARTIDVQTDLDPRGVKVSVIDRGVGIEGAALARVFDAFWTTKEHGLGVGLAICKAIADAHHGSLTADNNAAGGATFRLVLPIAEARREGADVERCLPG